MELILIRHGQTPGNLKRQYIGCTDQPLAPEGEELARRRQAEMPPIEKLWVSPMKRCRQTAALLWPELDQEAVDDLRECDFGIFEQKSYEQLKSIPAYRAWIGNEPGCGCPGGEGRAEFAARCVRGMEEVLRRSFEAGYERCGVVAHGGTIMEALSHYMPGNTEIYQWMPKNCGGFRVRVTESPRAFELMEVLE